MGWGPWRPGPVVGVVEAELSPEGARGGCRLTSGSGGPPPLGTDSRDGKTAQGQ